MNFKIKLFISKWKSKQSENIYLTHTVPEEQGTRDVEQSGEVELEINILINRYINILYPSLGFTNE